MVGGMVGGSVVLGGGQDSRAQNEVWTRMAVRTGAAAPGGANAPSAAKEATPATIMQSRSTPLRPRMPDHHAVDRLGRVISVGYDRRRRQAGL